MKAVRFHEHGDSSVLKFEDAPEPKAGHGEAVVRVKACALNHLDLFMREGVRGWPVEFPHITGSDVAGEIAEIGEGVEGWREGDKVMLHPGLFCGQCRYCFAGLTNRCVKFGIFGAHSKGGYAEYVKIAAHNLGKMPDNLDFVQAASMPLVFLTAWHMLITRGESVPGETVLVMAAGSGVGVAAIQMARMMGLRVIAAASTDEKLARAVELGAHLTVNYSNPEWPNEVKRLTDGEGVNIVIEHIGGDKFNEAFKTLAKGGRIVTCGATAGFSPNIDLRFVYSRELQLTGSMLGRRYEFDKVLEAIRQGHLKPVADSVFPLAEAKAAQEKMADRNLFGKIVLTP